VELGAALSDFSHVAEKQELDSGLGRENVDRGAHRVGLAL